MRFSEDGIIDLGFGNNGIETESINGNHTFGLNITFQSTNIVAGGGY